MLAIRPNSENYDVQTVNDNKDDDTVSNDPDDIPYHIRKNAKPFTYGNLPIGFTKNELNHVEVDKPRERKQLPALPPPSPSMLRKRPNITPSPPVLHKTPTREEFEELLLEKRERSLRDKENLLKKQIQSASVEKDLNELQEKLNIRLALEDSHNKLAAKEQNNNLPIAVIHEHSNTVLENDEMPSGASSYRKAITQENFENVLENNKSSSPFRKAITLSQEHLQNVPPENNRTHSPIRKAITHEHRQMVLENGRVSPFRKAETPAFPEIMDDRCTSPYLMLTDKTISTVGQLPAGRTHSIEELRDNNAFTVFGSDFYEVAPHLVKYAKDTSEFWYKPNITRQEAVSLLRNAEPGTFVIRNSTTYKNAYGLVLRVAKPPPGVYLKQGSNNEELVRHFLLEPSTRGVRLKGYANEPLFTSLSAFVYEHSTNPLALPCKLVIPDQDILYSSRDAELIAVQKTLSTQGAACNVLYLFSYNTESLTGDEAIRKTVYEMFARRSLSLKPVEVHFKVTQQGITLTDNTRTQFFRRFFTANHISYCGLDPDKRFWSVSMRDGDLERVSNKTIFAFVARPLTGSKDNECHIFCDLADSQPASAIVSFINKVIPINRRNDAML